MAKPNEAENEEGWSKEGAAWFNSLSIEEVVDIKILSDYGVQDDEDQAKLERLRESFEKATGETWE